MDLQAVRFVEIFLDCRLPKCYSENTIQPGESSRLSADAFASDARYFLQIREKTFLFIRAVHISFSAFLQTDPFKIRTMKKRGEDI